MNVYDKIDRLLEPEILAKGYMTPRGITIHYTASEGSAEDVLAVLKSQNLGYHLIIERDGSVVQTCYFTRQVWHAGKASWLGVSPNRAHISVALIGWGYLTRDEHGRYHSWTGEEISPSQVCEFEVERDWPMYWHRATDAQKQSLFSFLVWAGQHLGIRPEQICSHHECAQPIGRKMDIGGMLAESPSAIRKRVADALLVDNLRNNKSSS